MGKAVPWQDRRDRDTVGKEENKGCVEWGGGRTCESAEHPESQQQALDTRVGLLLGS